MKFLGKLLIIIIALNPMINPVFAKHKHTTRTRATPKYVNKNPAYTYNTANLTAVINQIVNSVEPGTTVGIDIKSMKYGDTLYAKNSRQPLTPASILKLLTAEAALLYLGADYKYPTRIETTAAHVDNGTVNGDVYLVHSGDPTLNYYDLADLMVSLKSQQIQRISGNLYIDNTAYDQNNIGPGWTWSDTRYCYAAPINASIINHICITFQIAPAKTEGRLANIIQNPKFYYSGIENSVVTKATRSRFCSLHLSAAPNSIINVYGCMPKGYYARGASIVVNNIVDYNKTVMKNLFDRFNIRLNGNIAVKSAPSNLSVIAAHESNPLRLLINDMLKNSNNVIAGSLFKKMGELYAQQPGSWRNGSLAVSQILQHKVEMNTAQMKLIDGSGLSRDNKVTPAQIMEALDFAFHNYSINYEFISALPIAGVDGTLKHRLKNVARKVRAKTGTIAGVVSLAGYAVGKNKEPIAFVIILNGRGGNIWKYREMEDKIITALTHYSRNPTT